MRHFVFSRYFGMIYQLFLKNSYLALYGTFQEYKV